MYWKKNEAAKKECIESANLVDELNNIVNIEAAAVTLITKLNEERISFKLKKQRN